ncbi:MAG: hypothetical protein QME51_06550 [Planctomycetota bacterium]|nr:hypothetical protein [Planctomycetota bacterium]MDI6788012.1 hypothetical protein [Planctomycetota bacterium]
MTNKFKKYYVSLTAEEMMLLTLRDELYGGQWERMIKDLNDRLNLRPYIFKLVNRIKDDLQRIQKLQEYEKKHGINISDYIVSEEEKHKI